MRMWAKILSIPLLALLVMGWFGPSNYRQGKRHLERGEYVQALEALTNALNEDPDNAKIHRDLGTAYYRTEQYQQALTELDQAKEKLKKDGQVMFFLGMTHERLEQYDKAIEAYSNYSKLGRFSSLKREIQRRIQWLIQKQAAQWVKERMEMEKRINPASIPDNTIAVTYFKPFGVSEELEPLHKGLTDLLIADLSLVEALQVLERIKLKEIYDELGLASTDLVDKSTTPRIGRLMGASSVVTGIFTGLGDDEWRIDPTLGRIKVGESLGLERLEGEIAAFLETEKQLVMEILRNLGIELTQEEEEKIAQNIPTTSLSAFLAYCRGLDYTDQGMYREAARAFDNAVSIDPGFNQARESATGAKLLFQPVGGVGTLESAWDSTLSAEAGKDALLNATVGSIAQGDVKSAPSSELGIDTTPTEIELEVVIRW